MKAALPEPLIHEPPHLRFVIEQLRAATPVEQVGDDGFPIFAKDELRDTHLLINKALVVTGWLAKLIKRKAPESKEAESALLENSSKSHASTFRAIITRVLWNQLRLVAQHSTGHFEKDFVDYTPCLSALFKRLLEERDSLSASEWALYFAAFAWPNDMRLGTSWLSSGMIQLLLTDHLRLGDVLVILKGQGLDILSAEARAELKKIQEQLSRLKHSRESRAIAGRIAMMLGGDESAVLEPGEAWSDQALQDLTKLPERQRIAWNKLFRHCLTATSPKPTGKWLKSAAEKVTALGDAEFRAGIVRWFPLVALRRPIQSGTIPLEGMPDPDWLISDRNANILKGLVWCCSGAGDVSVTRALSELAEVCFKKVRWLGPRCPKVGNACLHVLSNAKTEDAAAQLSRLDATVVQPTARKRIDKSLNQAAELTGQTREDLEEKAVPTYGLDGESKLTRLLGEHTATIQIEDSRTVELNWRRGEKPVKTIPAEVKRSHAEELKDLQRVLKDIQKMLPAQRVRIERLLMTGRRWDLGVWRGRYLNQPLLAPIARRLIWHFQLGEHTSLGAWRDGKIVDAEGKALDWLAPETTVRLWHPIGFGVETVQSWRRWLETNEVCQPFKQAHREIYVLTDAELTTDTYSNRFAAHIIGQHQFAALAKQRGWKYSFMGGFDFQSTPTLELPAWNLAVEFWVQPAGELADSGVARYLTTDQVRFVRGGETVPLRDVPATVFTEVMRDVDLFVGVGSIGNDPAWQDQGEMEGGGEYWQSYSFGTLNATAQTRKDVLERLVPRLKIAGQCSFAEKFLVVKGSLRTYKIHLGSGNILMEPNDQYLCIVPDRGSASAKAGEKVFLPFEGDGTLSIILSKAFLLAEDAKIKDETILRQIVLR